MFCAAAPDAVSATAPNVTSARLTTAFMPSSDLLCSRNDRRARQSLSTMRGLGRALWRDPTHRGKMLGLAKALDPTCTLHPAEPVVALIFPVAAEIFVGDGEFHHVFGVLEAEFGRHAHLHGKPVFTRQDVAIKAECHLRLRMQRGRHVDGG